MDIQADTQAPAVEGVTPLLWTGLLGSSSTLELLRWVKSQHGSSKIIPAGEAVAGSFTAQQLEGRNYFNGPNQQTVVVVCPSESQATEIFDQTLFFHKALSLSSPVLFYPVRETDFVSSQYQTENIVDQRLSVLYHCAGKKPTLIITSLKALAQKTIPRELFRKNIHAIMLHDDLNRDELIQKFFDAGYEREQTCRTQGTFSIRGDILDFFSPNHNSPIRVEFFGDQVERISYYDPDSQTSKSSEPLEYIEWIAAHEILLSNIETKDVLRKIKLLADDLDLPPESRSHLEESVREKILIPSMDHLFPVFYTQNETLIQHLPADVQWVLNDPMSLKTEIQNIEFEFQKNENAAKKLQSKAQDFLADLKDVEKNISLKTKLFLSEVDFEFPFSFCKTAYEKISLHQELQSDLIQNKKSEHPYQPLADRIKAWTDEGLALHIVASEASFDRIQKLLHPYLPNHRFEKTDHFATQPNPFTIFLMNGELTHGFSSVAQKIVILTETEIFGEKKFKQARVVTQENILESLSELQIGEHVVHIDHGIGIYQGLQKMTIAGIEHDFLVIQYLDQDKLFLPVYRLNRIHKYISADGKKAKVDRLGGQNWEQAKKKAQKAVEEMAQELIELYARRKVAKGYSYLKPDETYTEFEVEFPFEETRDQLKTIEEIFNDLESEKPMDRLVCGDVGFGKTEVALRAAYRVASEGKQVAVLVPTTILCQQHFETFKRRFKNFPVEIDFLSRFKTAADAKETVEQLKIGNLDIIIGTHRLLSKDVEFANLGLLILDEEHRFGVKHKEHIKKFRNKIDVLTLTATPIPRTLQLSMTGIRDLSVINTPPLDRKAVHTILCNFDDGLIRNAIMKELSRKGQVFFLHNRVESIYTMKQYVEKIVPEARIRVAHGQMNQQELEKTMLSFLNHEFDVLLSTTIIESGLDIPNANTLLVNRADTFGLSQLYQIRGRVGRSHQEAYAYFMVPDQDRMTRDAIKRLKVLKQFTELGSGLKISLHDMEIRGAGNLLGAKQSGNISNVGFELYSQLLEREIRKLKGEKIKEEIEPEIQINIAAFIPDDYIPEQTERLRFYKRLSGCKNEDELTLIEHELKDRFGAFPNTVGNLFEVVSLKMIARECGVSSLKITNFNPVIEFADHAPINIDRLLAMAQKSRSVRLTPDQKLLLHFESDLDPIEETKKVLRGLQERGKNT
jgi:transcription-repair coupling factor (superfamily II helicase)